MSESSAAEKTEEPTPRRLDKAREDGEVPRSRELATLVVTASSVIVVFVFGAKLGREAMEFLSLGLQLSPAQAMDTNLVTKRFSSLMMTGLLWTVPFLIAGLVASFIGPLAFGGWNISQKAITPDPKRLNPISGIGRLFSKNALMEMLKALLKFVMLGGLAAAVLWAYRYDVMALGVQDLGYAIPRGFAICVATFAVMCLGLAALAGIDVPFQHYSHRKKLKMSKQEIKDEMKESEGRPEVKQHIRQMQQEAARKRMAQDIPTADVVLNNPQHFSVALKYDQAKGGAPVVVAKGADHLAEVIRDLAREHRVTQLRVPPLARSLYHHVDIGDEIPQGLYLAVAQILSYVIALKNNPQQAGELPTAEVPRELRWNPAKH